jgi:exodeoxyribonuclease-5
MVYNLSGCAGSGKTTLVRYFIDYMGLDIKDVAFVAFMGKAAMQMARNGLPAQTIHSFIYDYEKVPIVDENGKIQVDDRGKVLKEFRFILKKELPKKVKLIVIDEASMVNKDIAEDILSFGVPVIALGDLNQLPPVFGNPYFLKNPDFILTQVMRQNEGDPIIWLSQRVLDGKPIPYGVYGKSCVIKKEDMNEYILSQADIVLTFSNRLRNEINTVFRENIKSIRKLEIPEVGEKIICRKNNWNRSIQNSIYLTNGMSGTIDYVDMESFNGKTLKIDFKPDFINKKFKNLNMDYKRLYATPGSNDYKGKDLFSFTRDQFEFAYAITVHLSQGSQYPSVVFLNERTQFSREDQKKLEYTAITRATKQITIIQ